MISKTTARFASNAIPMLFMKQFKKHTLIHCTCDLFLVNLGNRELVRICKKYYSISSFSYFLSTSYSTSLSTIDSHWRDEQYFIWLMKWPINIWPRGCGWNNTKYSDKYIFYYKNDALIPLKVVLSSSQITVKTKGGSQI